MTLVLPAITTATGEDDLREKTAGIPKAKPRSVKISTPTKGDDEDKGIEKLSTHIVHVTDFCNDLDIPVFPVPKTRSKIKSSDSSKNLEWLSERKQQQQNQPSQSDTVSLHSFDFTEETSRTDDPSVSASVSTRSQPFDCPLTATTTTEATTSEEPATESIGPSSELSIDDGNIQTEHKTRFYIGESSRNIITKTTPTKLTACEDDDPLTSVMTSDQMKAADISLMKEISVDSDDKKDDFMEYTSIKPTDPGADLRIRRQSSETRNDLLEEDIATAVSTVIKASDGSFCKTSTEQSITSQTSRRLPPIEVIHSTGKNNSIQISESMKIDSERPVDLDIPLEKAEFQTKEIEVPPPGKGEIIHSPQQRFLISLTKKALIEEMLAKTLDEVQESLDVAKNELVSVVKDGKSIKGSPSEFEFRSFSQTNVSSFSDVENFSDKNMKTKKIAEEIFGFMESEPISSFIGIPKGVQNKYLSEAKNGTTATDILYREPAMLHNSQNVFDEKKREIFLGFVPTGKVGSQDSNTSSEDDTAKDIASFGFISNENAEDFSSMEEYYKKKMVEGNTVTEAKEEKMRIDRETFSEITSELTIKPFDDLVHGNKTDRSENTQNRCSVPEIDYSSSSESYYKSFEKSQSRPLSSNAENIKTQTNSSEYQTAVDISSISKETTESLSGVIAFQSSSEKSISSHESLRSLDSQSEFSANLVSLDVSELSETLVALSTEEDLEIQCLKEFAAEEDSDYILDIDVTGTTINESKMQQQSQMKRSEEMIFKQKAAEIVQKPSTVKQEHEKPTQYMACEEFPKSKDIEKAGGFSYPKQETTIDDAKEEYDILLYHGDIRCSKDYKYASSLDEGGILSVSMSSTPNIETVVENFEEVFASFSASSLPDIDGFTASSLPEKTAFDMKIKSGNLSPQDLSDSTSPGDTHSEHDHERSENASVAGDESKDIPYKNSAVELGEGKESGSESDTDPYETEYARQFRSPTERIIKKKQPAAQIDRNFETEKRPFTPSQHVSEVIVEDSLTEELEAKKCLEGGGRPLQKVKNFSKIPYITVTEDLNQNSTIVEKDYFKEKSLYKIKTEEELHRATDDRPLHEEKSFNLKEENFQKLVQEQYKQKLAELKKAEIGDNEYDYKEPDSPDSFEMVDQPDISDEFVIVEEVAKEANEDDLEGKSIRIAPITYESKHDEEVEKIIIKSAPADPKLGSHIFRDDLNFEFEQSPQNSCSGSAGDESDSAPDLSANNKRWVEMQLTDNQIRYPYDLTGAVLEDIKEEDGEFEVGSSRFSSFKDSFSSTPEYDVIAARRYYASRGEHDDISMSSLQEFESLEQAISLENRNRTHQGSTDSSNGSFQRRYIMRNSSGLQGNEISISSLKEFEGLENACIEAHLIEIKAREEAALLSRSDESNKSSVSDRAQPGDHKKVVVTKLVRTASHTEPLQPRERNLNIENLLKEKSQECEAVEASMQIREISKTKTDSDKGSIGCLEMNRSIDTVTSTVEDNFDISKDSTTKSHIDSLKIDEHQLTRQERIESSKMEYMDDFMPKFNSILQDGITTTTSTDVEDGHEYTTTSNRVEQKTRLTSGAASSTSLQASAPEMISKDLSADSLYQLSSTEQTSTSSARTTAIHQTNTDNSQMSDGMTSCVSSALMEKSAGNMCTL